MHIKNLDNIFIQVSNICKLNFNLHKYLNVYFTLNGIQNTLIRKNQALYYPPSIYTWFWNHLHVMTLFDLKNLCFLLKLSCTLSMTFTKAIENAHAIYEPPSIMHTYPKRYNNSTWVKLGVWPHTIANFFFKSHIKTRVRKIENNWNYIFLTKYEFVIWIFEVSCPSRSKSVFRLS